MIALLRKDLALALIGVKQDILLILFFIGFTVFSGNNSYPMAKNIAVLLFYFILFGNIQHEQAFNCTKLLLSVPSSRKNYVISKYIIGIISLVFALGFNYILCYILSLLNVPGFTSYTTFELFSFSFSMLLFMIIGLPCCLIINYNFTKWISIIFMVSIISFTPLLLDNADIIINFINNFTIKPVLLAPLALILTLLSMFTTINLFEKRNF